MRKVSHYLRYLKLSQVDHTLFGRYAVLQNETDMGPFSMNRNYDLSSETLLSILIGPDSAQLLQEILANSHKSSITFLTSYTAELAPSLGIGLEIVHLALSTVIIALLFALIFKYLPDVHVPWRHVWLGSIVSSVLFGIGKVVIGLYIGKTALSSTYGAAGSMVVILVWV